MCVVMYGGAAAITHIIINIIFKKNLFNNIFTACTKILGFIMHTHARKYNNV